MKLILSACALLAAATVAAGCGDDDDELTKAEFRKQANAICKKGNDALEKAAAQAFGNQAPSKTELNRFTETTLVPNVQQQIDGIRDLDPPSEDEDQVNALLDEAQSALDKIEADPANLTPNRADPFARANRLAGQYGLQECAG